MASVKALADTTAAVKSIDFSPIFQSFKNKTKRSSTQRKNAAGVVIFFIHLDHSHSSRHTLNTTGISAYSNLNIQGKLKKKKKSPSIENKFSVILQSHRTSAPPLRQLSNNTQTDHIVQSRRAQTSSHLAATKRIKKLKITIKLHSCEAYKRNMVKFNRCKEFYNMLQLGETQCLGVCT